MRACGIINIKLGRVAGFTEAMRLHDVAQAAGIPVWCGMLEAGIGRATTWRWRRCPTSYSPATSPPVSATEARHHRSGVETTPYAPSWCAKSGLRYALDHDFIRSITVREESIG